MSTATGSAREPPSPDNAISTSPGAETVSATMPIRLLRSAKRCEHGEEDRSRVDGQDRHRDRGPLERLEEEGPVEGEQEAESQHLRAPRHRTSTAGCPRTAKRKGKVTAAK